MIKPNPILLAYREELHRAATNSGLEANRPVASNNYVKFASIKPGSHIGVSVGRNLIRVTLNNDRDVDGHVFRRLLQDRDAIDRAVGESLDWGDTKDDRIKTVVRAAREGGYATERSGWAEQHIWAINMVRAFRREFAPRL